MSLKQITTRTFYLPGANNLGVVACGDGSAIAVDTGLDKDSGRVLRKAIDAAGFTLRAIISTHHHADHVGGNAYLLRNVPGVEVHAPPLEAALIAHPVLEPVYLNYGAAPLASLRTRWLMAPSSPVHHEIGTLDAIARGDTQQITIAGVDFDLIGLPGHSPAQVGVAVDGVCFAADGFFGPAVLAKHGVPYAHDIAAQLASLDTLAARADDWFLPGHGDLVPRDEFAHVLAANRAAIEQASAHVLAALAEPGTVDELTERVLQRMQHTVAGIPQYAIFRGAVAAHLTLFEQRGQAQAVFANNHLAWQHVDQSAS